MLDLAFFGRRLGQTARLMIGVPDYAAYVAHMRKAHPGLPVMTEAEFFRNRQDRRFGAVRNGCICRCC